MKIYRALFVLIAFGAAASPSRAQTLAPNEIKDLLARIHQHRAAAPDVQADFREEKMLHLLAKPLVSVGRVWFEAPNKFRRELKGSSPSVTVSNGAELWIYYPNFRSAEHYSLGKRSPVDAVIAAINAALNLENVESTFQISGTRVPDGYELQLRPRTESMKRIFQRFDLKLNSDLLAERTNMIQPNGDHVTTVYSSQSRAAIPPATFQFSPPPGTDVTNPLGR